MFMDKDSEISASIAQLINSGMVHDLARLYDLILDNPEIATKDELLQLLKAMKRPKPANELQADNGQILRNLDNFVAFYNYFNDSEYKLDKAMVIRWLDTLSDVPDSELNDREIELKHEYIQARDSKDFIESDEGDRYKDIFDKINKYLPKGNKKNDRVRKIDSF